MEIRMVIATFLVKCTEMVMRREVVFTHVYIKLKCLRLLHQCTVDDNSRGFTLVSNYKEDDV